jgi:hypothetical protein
MAKKQRNPTPASRRGKASSPNTPAEPVEPRVYTEEAAERHFCQLPSRLDETLAVVRYTGRKRAYIHYGRAGDTSAFWYLIRSDGPRLLKVYPGEQAAECFSELLTMIQGWRESVNPDPMSPSYCDICPEVAFIELTMRTRYLGLDV